MTAVISVLNLPLAKNGIVNNAVKAKQFFFLGIVCFAFWGGSESRSSSFESV